jgi:hypothetical protein
MTLFGEKKHAWLFVGNGIFEKRNLHGSGNPAGNFRP